jgi:hypothetical protein
MAMEPALKAAPPSLEAAIDGEFLSRVPAGLP